MGGMIVQSLAVRHPRVVRRVVLMASAPGDGKATLPSQEALAALASDDPAGLLGGLLAEGKEAVRDGYLARIARRRAFDPLVAPAVRSRQLGAAGGWLLGQDADGARVRRLRMPVLVGSGALDPLLPAANQRHLAKAIPRATLVQYPDASHGFFIQHRRRFLRTVNRFLD
jgi:pimeloyl-ACP methyl ester carboxylesterase